MKKHQLILELRKQQEQLKQARLKTPDASLTAKGYDEALAFVQSELERWQTRLRNIHRKSKLPTE